MRVGIVVIHGIAPHPRYQIEDELATALTARLNKRDGHGTWVLESVTPPLAPTAEPESVRATVDRVSRANHDAYDVLEAYWSPIDKNHTTPVSVAAWLLKSIFVPLNNNARFPGSPWKIIYDVGYVLVALAFAVSLLLFMLWAAGQSYGGVVSAVLPTPPPAASASPKPSPSPPPLPEVLANPLRLAQIFSIRETLIVIAGAVGAICFAQALSAVLGGALVRRSRARSPGRPHWRAALRIVAVFALGAGFLLLAARLPLDNTRHFGATLWWFIAAVLALQGASALGRGFLVDRLGDVQIYTTTDENSQYFDLRSRIRSEAEKVLLRALARSENSLPYYDHIVVATHSLGSTIGMDALLRVHEIHEASPGKVSDSDWGRVRAFITFGTALEKTKFFFAVRRPSFSQAREGWRNDLSGHLFTDDPAVLATSNTKNLADPLAPLGIFWLNFWYPTDIIANAIESYRSYERPRLRNNRTHRMHPVCLNQRLTVSFFRNPFPHGAYLADDSFWRVPQPVDPRRSGTPLGALDILERLLPP